MEIGNELGTDWELTGNGMGMGMKGGSDVRSPLWVKWSLV